VDRKIETYERESEQRRAIDREETKNQIQNDEKRSNSRMACLENELDQVKTITVGQAKQLASAELKISSMSMSVLRQF